MNDVNDYKNISTKNIDTYYDLYDKACMLLVNKLNLNYLQAFLRIYNDIKEGYVNQTKLEDKDIKLLEEYENNIISLYFLNEEIRSALLLLLIKAFKHVCASLDLITPDYIGLLFTFIIQNLFARDIKKEKIEKISILDINLGTGNLINLIANNLEIDCNLAGIEIDQAYAYISEAFSDLQGNDIEIYNNSCISNICLSANAIIGDLDCKYEGEKYLPYAEILKYQNTNLSRSFMIFMVDNDFFNQPDSQKFKENLKGTIIGLIVLPQELFKKKQKIILIISPKKYKNVDTLIMNLPNMKEAKKYKEALMDIKAWLKKF